MNWRIEHTEIGRIVSPGNLPDGVALFCTTSDFEGRLTSNAIDSLSSLLRDRFASYGAIASCGQVHGAGVATTGRRTGHWTETPDCDALVSFDTSAALAIKIADCLPVTLYDTEQSSLANIHSGWRGAAMRVVPTTLERLCSTGGTTLRHLRAWLGPSIRGCCFEVGEEVVEALTAAYGEIGSFVDRNLGPRPHVDLAGLTCRILADSGVREDSIDDSGICTRCEGSIFHSYRRDGARSGRNLMIVARTA